MSHGVSSAGVHPQDLSEAASAEEDGARAPSPLRRGDARANARGAPEDDVEGAPIGTVPRTSSAEVAVTSPPGSWHSREERIGNSLLQSLRMLLANPVEPPHADAEVVHADEEEFADARGSGPGYQGLRLAEADFMAADQHAGEESLSDASHSSADPRNWSGNWQAMRWLDGCEGDDD